MSRARIREEDLEMYLTVVEEVRTLKETLRNAESTLGYLEGNLKEALKSGAKPPKGWQVFVETVKGAVRPAWKNAFIDLCKKVGLEARLEVERVIQDTPASTKEVLRVSKGTIAS